VIHQNWATRVFLAAFEPDLLVLIVQLVVQCKDIRDRVASARTGHPNEFVDLHDCIQCQLVQVNLEVS
jgi:hypothetical protein